MQRSVQCSQTADIGGHHLGVRYAVFVLNRAYRKMVHRPVRECVDAGGLIAQLHTAAGTVQRLLQIRKGLQIPAAEDCGEFLHPVIDQTQQTVAVKVADGRR